jgi:hypothetical protein
VPQGHVELVPLDCHLGQAHVCDACRGHGRAVGRRGDRQRLLVGAMRRVQAALGELNLAEMIAHHRAQAALAGLPPLGDSRRERALSLAQSAAQPLGQGQIPPGYGLQHPLVFTYVGQGPRRE